MWPAHMQEVSEDGTLRTLSRGLQVLELLEQVENMGFLELQRSTGLPMASLNRILQTLVRAGWVSQRLADQRYRINRGRMALVGWERARAVVAESATVHLDQLRREVLWPSDIFICDGAKMVILESNRSVSPLTSSATSWACMRGCCGPRRGGPILRPAPPARKIGYSRISQPPATQRMPQLVTGLGCRPC